MKDLGSSKALWPLYLWTPWKLSFYVTLVFVNYSSTCGHLLNEYVALQSVFKSGLGLLLVIFYWVKTQCNFRHCNFKEQTLIPSMSVCLKTRPGFSEYLWLTVLLEAVVPLLWQGCIVLHCHSAGCPGEHRLLGTALQLQGAGSVGSG